MSKLVRSISVGLIVFISVTADGQSVRQAGQTIRVRDCTNPADAARSYQRCGLKLERTVLRLQGYGEVLAERGVVQPIMLTRFVRGDSALSLASSYERQMLVGRVVQILGVSTAAIALGQRQWCPAKLCSRENHDALTTAMYAGAGVLAISVPIQLHGRAKGRRAVAIYNASLAR
jgi:hypothetical protein